MNSPTTAGSARTYATRGLNKVVNPTNYPGPSSFVSPLEAPPDYDYSRGTGQESDYELFGVAESTGTGAYAETDDVLDTGGLAEGLAGSGFIDFD